jgi:putative hydrolase of the HAD superfamily
MAIRTVIFDFGNVVGFFDHGSAVAQLAAYTDMAPAELTLILYGSAIEDQYERGAIDTAQYIAAAKRDGRLTCSDEQFQTAFTEIFWPNLEVCQLVPRLKPRYRLVLASNTTPAHYDAFVVKFADTFKHFDYLGTSFAAGARKPEAAFFAAIQQHAKALPGECAFIDDLPTNIDGAREFGWRGIVYRPDGTLTDKLRALGVEAGAK